MSITNDTTNAIINYLLFRGCLVWRNSAAHVYGSGKFHKVKHNGVGDIVGLTATGKHLEIEVKIGKDKIRPEQIAHGLEVTKRGGFYFVATSLDDVVRIWEGKVMPNM